MAASTQNDYLAGMMQVMRPKLQELLEMSQTAASLIKSGTEVYQISKQDFRMPTVVYNGGDFGGFDINGGNLGLGSGMRTEQLVQTYYPTKLGIQLTLEAMWTTENNKTAILNAFKENMKRGMQEAQIYDDLCFHNITGNQGIIGQVHPSTSVGSISGSGSTATQTVTMEANFGSQLLRMNMPVEVYDSTLGTQKTAGGSPDNLPRVKSFDPNGKTVTLTNVNTSSNITAALTNSDYLLFPGSNTAGFFPTGTSAAFPYFRQGLYFFNTTTTSGSFLGLSRTQYPELNSNFVNAGGLLNPMHVMLLKHRILQRRSEVPQLQALIHPAQIARITEQIMSLSTWTRGKSDGPIDPLPNVGNDITWCGLSHKADIRQNRSRIDYINPKVWGRARLKDLDFLSIDGKQVFESRATNGGLAASVLMYLIQVENFYCVDPGSQGFIQNLTIPSGY
jgi:hypothetical protein